MADTYQHSSAYAAGDLAFHNYGLTDIPANVGVNLDLTSTSLVANSTTAPIPDAYGIVLPTASATVLEGIGVTMEVIKAGTRGRVRTQGIAPMIANGTVTAGDCVMISSTTAKLGWAVTQTSALPQCGKALTTATDGNLVDVLLRFAFNH
jgi:hypothetical protein